MTQASLLAAYTLVQLAEALDETEQAFRSPLLFAALIHGAVLRIARWILLNAALFQTFVIFAALKMKFHFGRMSERSLIQNTRFSSVQVFLLDSRCTA